MTTTAERAEKLASALQELNRCLEQLCAGLERDRPVDADPETFIQEVNALLNRAYGRDDWLRFQEELRHTDEALWRYQKLRLREDGESHV